MEVELTSHFLKKAKRLNRNERSKLDEKTDWFRKNYKDPRLKTHSLTGKLKGAFSFSVTHSIRVIFRIGKPGEAVFLDIGSHDEVYRS